MKQTITANEQTKMCSVSDPQLKGKLSLENVEIPSPCIGMC